MKAISSTPMSNLIGCVFKELRYERGVDQDFVALRLGLSVSTVSKIELGNVSVTVESVYRLCELFGIDMIDFFRFIDDAKNYLDSIGVKVYVDKSLKVKAVDKRVVSYEIEKKYEDMADIILPPSAIELSRIMDMDAIFSEEILAKIKSKRIEKSGSNLVITKTHDSSYEKSEAKEDTQQDGYDLPILHIKQLYVLLEDFFAENTVPLSVQTQNNINEMYRQAELRKKNRKQN